MALPRCSQSVETEFLVIELMPKISELQTLQYLQLSEAMVPKTLKSLVASWQENVERQEISSFSTVQ
jgi:hypothetical protein